MMMTKIVADSSADLLTLGDLPFASVPLTIHAGDRVFVDNEHCDIDGCALIRERRRLPARTRNAG